MKQHDSAHLLKHFDIKAFQDNLINWYQEQKRTLPWRMDQDPYKVWVSEIMLQQTQVDTVIPYFERFIELFPTPEALAKADEQLVLKAWEGLGYYSRARNLQTAVKEVSEKYDGKVPDQPDELGKLKGVGPYTLGAILSIAYNQPEPAVDGNVMRVMARVLQIEEDIAKQRTRRLFETVIREIIARDDPSSFNQGLMELGALICKPKTPNCMICPVQSHCKAYSKGTQKELPIKTKAKKQKRLAYFTIVFEDDAENIWIEQRPSEGMLANLWQFPMVLKDEIDELEKWIEEHYQFSIEYLKKLEPITHTFSHVIWDLDVYHCKIKDKGHKANQFVPLSTIVNYPFPVSHQKIIDQITALY